MLISPTGSRELKSSIRQYWTFVLPAMGGRPRQSGNGFNPFSCSFYICANSSKSARASRTPGVSKPSVNPP